MSSFYLCDLIGAGTRLDPFRPRIADALPAGTQWEAFDLRNDATLQAGVCLVRAQAAAPSVPAGAFSLGANILSAVIPPAALTAIQTRTGISMTGVSTVVQAFAALKAGGWGPLTRLKEAHVRFGDDLIPVG